MNTTMSLTRRLYAHNRGDNYKTLNRGITEMKLSYEFDGETYVLTGMVNGVPSYKKLAK